MSSSSTSSILPDIEDERDRDWPANASIKCEEEGVLPVGVGHWWSRPRRDDEAKLLALNKVADSCAWSWARSEASWPMCEEPKEEMRSSTEMLMTSSFGDVLRCG